MTFADIKKMPKKKIVGYIVLIALAAVLWFISIPAIGVYLIIKKTNLTKGKKWLASAGFVVAYIIVFGMISQTVAKEPTITISEPQNNILTENKEVSIKGKVEPQASTLKINEENVSFDIDGNFNYQAKLPNENNVFVIVANNNLKIKKQELIIRRTLTEQEKAEIAKKQKEEQDKIKAEEKRKADVLAKMRVKTDDIKKVSFYSDKTTPERADTNNINLYIIKSLESDSKVLKLRIQYEGDNWLFIQKYTIKADDKILEIIPPEVERDNYANVWEWSDFAPSDEQINHLIAVVNSKEAKIRYEGPTYQKDRIITQAEKTAIKNVLEAYKALGE